MAVLEGEVRCQSEECGGSYTWEYFLVKPNGDRVRAEDLLAAFAGKQIRLTVEPAVRDEPAVPAKGDPARR